jgi:hypothetical protein
MKRQPVYLFMFVLALLAASSCVDEGYDWDKVNKEAAFSHENGLAVQIGNFDTIRFKTQVEVPAPVDIEYIKEVEGIFSGEMYEYFVYDNKGKEEPLGDIRIEADFIARIKDAAGKNFSDFTLFSSILKENGGDTGIPIDEQVYKADTEQPQSFVVNIKKDDIAKLKEAYAVRLTFVFQARKVEREDYVLIENIWLKLSGGISISL